jgi:hypothetical protein
MNEEQRAALQNLCDRYHVPFNEDDYRPTFDLPEGYVAGWVGGVAGNSALYVGCSPTGEISS